MEKICQARWFWWWWHRGGGWDGWQWGLWTPSLCQISSSHLANYNPTPQQIIPIVCSLNCRKPDFLAQTSDTDTSRCEIQGMYEIEKQSSLVGSHVRDNTNKITPTKIVLHFDYKLLCLSHSTWFSHLGSDYRRRCTRCVSGMYKIEKQSLPPILLLVVKHVLYSTNKIKSILEKHFDYSFSVSPRSCDVDIKTVGQRFLSTIG